MISAWTDHLKTEEEKKQFRDVLQGSDLVIDRLIELMKRDYESLSKREVSAKVYDKPNWKYRQAHANGHLECLIAYLNLLNLDQKETNEYAVRPEQPGTTVRSD